MLQIALDDLGSFLMVDDEENRAMPSRQAVMAAGRYDLHHAVQYHGGYRAVSVTSMGKVKVLGEASTLALTYR
jgi:hypothetical protein